jgi:hypothetical protein
MKNEKIIESIASICEDCGKVFYQLHDGTGIRCKKCKQKIWESLTRVASLIEQSKLSDSIGDKIHSKVCHDEIGCILFDLQQDLEAEVVKDE